MEQARARPIDNIVVCSRLTDGTAVCLRTITPDDADLLRQGIAKLSAEARQKIPNLKNAREFGVASIAAPPVSLRGAAS